MTYDNFTINAQEAIWRTTRLQACSNRPSIRHDQGILEASEDSAKFLSESWCAFLNSSKPWTNRSKPIQSLRIGQAISDGPATKPSAKQKTLAEFGDEFIYRDHAARHHEGTAKVPDTKDQGATLETSKRHQKLRGDEGERSEYEPIMR
jgi:hypothetical protein